MSINKTVAYIIKAVYLAQTFALLVMVCVT